MEESQPIIPVDAKKKELVGEFKNNEREYRSTGNSKEFMFMILLIPNLGEWHLMEFTTWAEKKILSASKQVTIRQDLRLKLSKNGVCLWGKKDTAMPILFI